MKPSARIKAVEEILSKILMGRIPMDLMIGDYMRNRRYIGSKDRAFIAEKTYDIMRHYGRITTIASHLEIDLANNGASNDQSTRLVMFIYMCLFQDRDFAAIKKIYDGAKFSPDPMAPQESDLVIYLLENRDDLLKHLKLPPLVECPEQYAQSLQSIYGGRFAEIMRGFINGAALDVRVNIQRASRQEIKESLEKDGVFTDETPYSPWGLRCQGKVHLAQTKAFKKGLIEIQDEGSQLISLLSNAQPGFQVLDYCAGGGGKTLAMAAAMAGKGRLVATDIDGKRLAKTKLRLKRAGLSDNVELRPLDEKRHKKWAQRQKDNFDVVLIDAPCTGTGTWRRNPDTRWFEYGPSLNDICQVQAEILSLCASIPKQDGGRLVYATCSILPEENERQIEAFLAAHPDYDIVPLDEAWPDNNCPSDLKGKDFLRLNPTDHNTDGFFTAILRRKNDGTQENPCDSDDTIQK